MRINRQSSRLKALADSLLGPVIKTVREGISGPARAGTGWAFFPRAVKEDAEVYDELLGAGWRTDPRFSNIPKKQAGVRDALAARIRQDPAGWQGSLNAAWQARYGQNIPPEVARWVNNVLLNAINPLNAREATVSFTNLTGSHMKSVMGHQIIDTGELAHRLIDAHEHIEDIGEVMVFNQGREQARNASGVYAGIPGQFDQVAKVVTRSSNGAHGYVHEVVTSIYRQEKWVGNNPLRSLVAGMRVRTIAGTMGEGFDLLRREGNKLFPEELKAVEAIRPYLGRVGDSGQIEKIGSIYEQVGQKFRGILDESGGKLTESGLPEVKYINDAGEEVTDELQLEAFATFAENRARSGMKYQDIELEEAVARVAGDLTAGQAACNVTNALFANKAPLTQPVRNMILDTVSPKLRTLIEPVLDNPDLNLTVAEAMWLRVLVHDSEKIVSANVLGYARSLGGLDDSFSLSAEFLDADVIPLVGVGWWLDPRNVADVSMGAP